MTLPAQDIVLDPLTILAGIEQFGLAADGCDLRDLKAVISRLTADNEALRKDVVEARERWEHFQKLASDHKDELVAEIKAAETEVGRLREENRRYEIACRGAVLENAKMRARADALAQKVERLRGALEAIRDFPKPGTSRRTEDGYPDEIAYDEFAYRRIVDSYREAASAALGERP